MPFGIGDAIDRVMSKRIYLKDAFTGRIKFLGLMDYDLCMAKVSELRKRFKISGLDLGDGSEFIISVERV